MDTNDIYKFNNDNKDYSRHNSLGAEIKYFDQDALFKAIKIKGSFELAYATDDLRGDMDVMIFIMMSGLCCGGMRYASKNMMSNKILTRLAIKIGHNFVEYFMHLHPSLLNDKELMTEAVQKHGGAYRYIGEDLMDDKDIVLDLVQSDQGTGIGMSFMPKYFYSDKEVFTFFMANYNYPLAKFFDSFIKNKEYFLEQVLNNPISFFSFYEDRVKPFCNYYRKSYENIEYWESEEITEALQLGVREFCKKIINDHFNGKINIFEDFDNPGIE